MAPAVIPVDPDPTKRPYRDPAEIKHNFKPTPTDTSKDPPPSAKDGHFYDSCPDGCCRDVDRSFKSGGTDGRGETYLDWAMFHSPCGLTWTRTTKQGLARDEARGVRTKYKAGDVGRFVSVPSRRFQANYERIFGHS